MYRVSSLKSIPLRSDSPLARPAIRRARLVMLLEPGTGTTASIGPLIFSTRIESDNKLPVFKEEISVDCYLTTIAKIANHVPVHSGQIFAAGFRVAGADCHVDGATDLFIEEDVASESIDIEVGTN